MLYFTGGRLGHRHGGSGGFGLVQRHGTEIGSRQLMLAQKVSLAVFLHLEWQEQY